MLNYENKGKTIINTKTGNQGVVACEYRSTRTNKLMVEVENMANMKTAHWLLSNCEF
jgi:hypothetical protein